MEPPQATPPAGRRHLKTLSLSSPSPSRTAGFSSLRNQGPSSTSPAYSNSPSSNPLRLSMRSNASVDDAILEDAPWTAPLSQGQSQPDEATEQEDPSALARSGSGRYQRHGRTSSDRKSLNRLSLSSDISSVSASSSRSGFRTSWGSSSHGGAGSVDFSTGSPGVGVGESPAKDLAALKKSRRQSSISYTRDPGTYSPAALSPMAVNRSAGGDHGPATPASATYASPLSTSSTSAPAMDDAASSQGTTAPASPAISQQGASTPSKPATPGSGATLVEQHADLLSFIAKKERKCLDLREELKRHDEELKALKKKWEAIVARDQQQQQSFLSPGPGSSMSLSPNLSGNRSPKQPSSPNTQATPLDSPSLAARSSAGAGGEDQPLSMGVGDVAAARKWMGGWMKQGMAGVAGIMEGMSESRSSSDLGTVREEEEGDEDAGRAVAAAASPSAAPAARSASSHGDDALLVNVDQPQQQQHPQEARANGDRDFKSLLESKYNKRRSTFDMNWGDALKRSQKAALGFVETFERTIADSLVLPPSFGEDGHHVSMGDGDHMYESTSPNLAPPSPTPSGSRSRTPSPRHSPSMRKQTSFNWDAALDDSGADIGSTPLQASAQSQQQQAPKTADARVRAARAKHAKRQSMPAFSTTTAASPPVVADSADTDGWGW